MQVGMEELLVSIVIKEMLIGAYAYIKGTHEVLIHEQFN